MSLSLGVSGAIFFLIAIREWLPAWLKIWHIMTAGAVAMLALGQITPIDGFHAIEWDVILYLFAVFSIGTALYQSGLSHRIAELLLRFEKPQSSLTAFLVTFAILAALLTNDAAAVIGTPIAFVLARRTGVDPKVFLLGLCATVTIGSMATPIGNPQNLLIAESGRVPAPVFTFFLWLIVPTIVSMLFVIWWLGRSITKTDASAAPSAEVKLAEEHKMWPYFLSGACLFLFVVTDSVVSSFNPELGIPLGIAAFVACIPVYLFSQARRQILVSVDWPTLIFFVAMFIVTGALIGSGSLQSMLGGLQSRMDEPLITAGISFVGSQVFSNVPLVDMYLKLMGDSEVANLMMLSAISTLAGNVFIISAASNVIVVQQSDLLGNPSFTFSQFSKAVLPIAAVSLIVTIAWIMLGQSLLN